jgi:hypothetical protein
MLLQPTSIVTRGLSGFESLAPLERDVFVVRDTEIYFEMEGSIGDWLMAGSRQSQVAWLRETLKRIGDLGSDAIIAKLQQLGSDQCEEVGSLSSQYYERSELRWKLLEKYLRGQGAELSWDA